MKDSGNRTEAPQEQVVVDGRLYEWRQDVLREILRIALAGACFAFVVCVWQALAGRIAIDNVFLTGIALVAVAGALWAPARWHGYRLGTLLTVFYFSALIGSLGGIVSLYGAGFVAFIAIASLFLGIRGTWMSVALTIVHTLTLAIAFKQDWLQPMIPARGLDPSSPTNWIRALVFLLVVAVVVAGCINSLLNRLRANLDSGLALIQKLEQEREQRLEMEEQMRRAERMQSLGRLAGGIAHDFNNALTVMAGEADYIVGEIGSDHPVGESAEIIQQATERTAALTRRLLLLGHHGEFLRPSVVDLVAVLNEFVRISRRVLPESIAYAFEKCDPAIVEVDESALHQALLNLAINAGDAMNQEGSITLSCGQTTLAEGETTLPAGSYGFVRVTDTGRGIPQESLQEIFDPFYSTKSMDKAGGMSLATTFGFATASHGTIEVESEVGVGTSFTFYFPISDKRLDAVGASLASIAALGDGRLALVAEDDLRVRAIIWSALTDTGFEVLEAADGEAALALTAKTGRTIDLLVTDFMMPKMDGVTLAEHCHGTYPNIQIVLVTGYATAGASARLGKLPNASLLPKPFSRRDLYRVLGSLSA